jgi:hypothetical protein
MSQMSAGTLQMMNMGLGAVSGGLSGIAQWKAGSAERNAYRANAELEIQKAAEEEQASAEKYTRLSGQQRLLYAQAGVDLSSGSPLLVMMDTAMNQAVASQRIRRAGQSRAAMLRYYGDQAASAGHSAGMSTFLTTLDKTANQAYEYSKANTA